MLDIPKLTLEWTLPSRELIRMFITMDEQEKRCKDEKTQQKIELPMEHARTSSEHGAIVLRSSPSSCRTFRIRTLRSPDPLLSGYSFSSSSETTSYPGFVDEQFETQSKGAFTFYILSRCRASHPCPSSGTPTMPTGVASTFTARHRERMFLIFQEA